MNVALLGRRDTPTDGVEDYCACLADALAAKGLPLQLVRVPWMEVGWPRALLWLARTGRIWRGLWVLPQYTVYKWSRRGFPFGFLPLVATLKLTGARIAIVYHDPIPYNGTRPIDIVRRKVQEVIVVQAARLANVLVSTVPPQQVPWMRHPALLSKAVLIPVGSNVLEPVAPGSGNIKESTPTIAVFGVTESRESEAELLAWVSLETARQLGSLRLRVFGRGAEQAQAILERKLEGSGVQLELDHIVPAKRARDLLISSHVEICVRGGVSTRRTSAIAGIVCGLPIVGYAGLETGFPITEAGVCLVTYDDKDALVQQLCAVLRDDAVRAALARRSAAAAANYFSWDAIASQYQEVLGGHLPREPSQAR